MLNPIEQQGRHTETFISDSDIPDPDVLPRMARFNILVRPLPVKEKTKTGIIIPTTTQENIHFLQTCGRVVSMGPDCFPEGSTRACEVGDTILWARGRGIRIKYKGVKYVILVDDEVLGVIDSPESLDEQYSVAKD